MAKTTNTTTAPTKAAPKGKRSSADLDKIKVALTERRDELQAEYDQTLAEITELQRDRLADSGGDDQAPSAPTSSAARSKRTSAARTTAT